MFFCVRAAWQTSAFLLFCIIWHSERRRYVLDEQAGVWRKTKRERKGAEQSQQSYCTDIVFGSVDIPPSETSFVMLFNWNVPICSRGMQERESLHLTSNHPKLVVLDIFGCNLLQLNVCVSNTSICFLDGL